MNNAHENINKLAPQSVIDFFIESCSEAGWVGCNVVIGELEGARPDGRIIESLGALYMFGTEGCVDGYPGINMVLPAMLG